MQGNDFEDFPTLAASVAAAAASNKKAYGAKDSANGSEGPAPRYMAANRQRSLGTTITFVNQRVAFEAGLVRAATHASLRLAYNRFSTCGTCKNGCRRDDAIAFRKHALRVWSLQPSKQVLAIWAAIRAVPGLLYFRHWSLRHDSNMTPTSCWRRCLIIGKG